MENEMINRKKKTTYHAPYILNELYATRRAVVGSVVSSSPNTEILVKVDAMEM